MGIQRTLRRNFPAGMIVPTGVKFMGHVVGIMVPVGSDPRIGRAFEVFIQRVLYRSSLANIGDILKAQGIISEKMVSGDWSGVMN